MKKYFNGAISQRELATIVRGALGAQLALHNTFIRALYTTAEAAAFVEELGPDWRTKIPKEKPLPLRPTNVPQQQPGRRNNQGFSTQRPVVAHPGGGQQRAPAQPKILWRVKYPALGTGAPRAPERRVTPAPLGSPETPLRVCGSECARFGCRAAASAEQPDGRDHGPAARRAELCRDAQPHAPAMPPHGRRCCLARRRGPAPARAGGARRSPTVPPSLPLVQSSAADVRFLPTCWQAYLKAAVNSCPEGSTPSGGGRSLDGSLAPPPQWRFAADNARPEPEFEPLETESELHDRATHLPSRRTAHAPPQRVNPTRVVRRGCAGACVICAGAGAGASGVSQAGCAGETRRHPAQAAG